MTTNLDRCIFAELLFFLFLLESSVSNAATTCGSLVTYNQYPDVLKNAPTCIQKGCGTSNITSMSGQCDSKAACYPLWQILNKEYQDQNNWCETCPGDVACRIDGWPVMNSTRACDTSPNTFLFSGGCCAASGEPADLAKWIGNLCNQTWKIQFEHFDRMAPRDWAEWIMPWNWTVQPDDTPHPDCSPTPRYLGLFAIENFIFLLAVGLYSGVTIWVIRGQQTNHKLSHFILHLLTPARFLKKQGKRLFGRIFPSSGSGKGNVLFAFLIALVMTSIQLGINFGTAVIIKNKPGYEHIPVHLLALLFCCRPRLGWLASTPGLIKDKWLLQRVFGLSPTVPVDYQRARTVVARMSLGAGLSEVIMQLLGVYFMGKTADVGVKRGFYSSSGKHLKPFWRGTYASYMYIGALFWLVAGLGIIVSWSIVVRYSAGLLRHWSASVNWWKNAAIKVLPEKLQTTKMKNTWPRPKSRPPPPPPPPGKDSSSGTGDSETMIGEGYIQRGDKYGYTPVPSGLQNIRGGGGSTITNPSGVSSSTAYDELPMRSRDFPTMSSSGGESLSTRGRDGYQAVPTDPEMLQMRRTDFQARASGRYQSIPEDPEMLPMRPADFTIPTIAPYNARSAYQDDQLRRRSPTRAQNGREDSIFISRGNPPPQFDTNTSYDGGRYREETQDVRAESPPFDPNQEPEYRKWMKVIIRVAVTFGFISYIAQWLFWAGFVYTAGEKFCPPDLATLGTLWTIASILGLGSLALGS